MSDIVSAAEHVSYIHERGRTMFFHLCIVGQVHGGCQTMVSIFAGKNFTQMVLPCWPRGSILQTAALICPASPSAGWKRAMTRCRKSATFLG